ncbi:MAG: NUDIX domain-containing protein [Desulfovibrionales bacterium]|nr:NUDIX domain-containing protein [Desulfovibrionales bacterium]
MPDIANPKYVSEDSGISDSHIEVIDAAGKPLAVMPSAVVHEQKLSSKSVFVFIYSKSGKVYLQRRSEQKSLAPGHWDISAATHVIAGEALEGAAVRVLQKELNLEPIPLIHVGSKQAVFPDGPLWISLYAGQLGNTTFSPNPKEVQDGMFVDEDELLSLYTHFRSDLTPVLMWAIQHKVIFSRNT